MLTLVKHDLHQQVVRVLTLDTYAHRVELAVGAVVMQDFCLVGCNEYHDLHDIEAQWTVDGLGAFVLERSGFTLLIDGEAGAAVERVYLFGEAVAAEGLRALDAVVHLVQDERARTRALTVHERRKVRSQRIHIY